MNIFYKEAILEAVNIPPELTDIILDYKNEIEKGTREKYETEFMEIMDKKIKSYIKKKTKIEKIRHYPYSHLFVNISLKRGLYCHCVPCRSFGDFYFQISGGADNVILNFSPYERHKTDIIFISDFSINNKIIKNKLNEYKEYFIKYKEKMPKGWEKKKKFTFYEVMYKTL